MSRRPTGRSRRSGPYRSASAPSYDPSSETTLALDLWAEAGVTQAGTGVASWVDGVGAVDFVQDTDSKRPTYEATGLGGKPSILGVAANADALVAAALSNAATSWTLIVFCQPISNGSTQHILDSQSGRLVFAQTTSSAGKLGYYDGTYRSIADGTTSPQVLTWVLADGVGGEMLRGSSSIGTGPYAAKAIGGACAVFSSFGGFGQYGDIRIGRLMLFSAIDSSRDGRVRGWGASHYGIAL